MYISIIYSIVGLLEVWSSHNIYKIYKYIQNEALSLGYRLFDCAPVYFNEKEIGDAFHESTSGVPRTDVFITSKLACPFHNTEHVEVRCI